MMTNNYRLPTIIEVDNKPFRIRDKGDFRMVFSCFNIMSDVHLTQEERLYASMIIFYEDFDDMDDLLECDCDVEALAKKMMWFLDCGENYETKNSPRLIDWDEDSNLICSAINNVAGKEIRAEKYVHWWTFIGYYMAIGECSLSNIVSIRYKLAKGEKLEKYEKKFMADNPQYFNKDMRSEQQKMAEDYVASLWKGELADG